MNFKTVSERSKPFSLCIILPVYNEDLSLPLMCNELMRVIPILESKVKVQICFVNNGSTDNSLEHILNYNFGEQAIGILTLSRNFGYESALVAGLQFSDSDVYALVDSDGEDPVDLLPKFLEEIWLGEDLVLGIRGSRHESLPIQMFRRLSYKFLSKVSDEPFTPNSGNFSMFRRLVRDAIISENKVYPFLRATLSRIGFSPKRIVHNRNPRINGRSKHRNVDLYKFAILGFMTSTTWPLRLITYTTAILLFLKLAKGLISYIISNENILLFVNLQETLILCILVAMSIFGLYLARVYKYTIGRPLYYINWAKSYELNGFQFIRPRTTLDDKWR